MRVDFAAVMERMRRLRAGLSHVDSVQRFRSLGVDVYIGEGRFAGGDVVEVDGRRARVRARRDRHRRARRASCPIPGSRTSSYLTNENVFWLTELPRRLVVLGAGPIGCELGAGVPPLRLRGHHRQPGLPAEGGGRHRRDRPGQLAPRRRRDRARAPRSCASRSAAARRSSPTRSNGERREVVADQVLLGAGRAPNVDGLGLETVGVEYSPKGVTVDDHAAHDQPAHLRRRRRLLALPVHARRRRAGAHRHPERAVLRPQEDERAAHPVVHLHRPRGGARRAQRTRRRGRGHRRVDDHRRAQGRRPRHPRRRDRGLRARRRAQGHGQARRADDRRRRTPAR